VISLAKFIQLDADTVLVGATESDPFHLCFREDSFDPVSRVRRGRFYRATGSTQEWNVIEPQNVTIPGSGRENGKVRVMARAYASINPAAQSNEMPEVVLLGSDSMFTVWTIVDIETIATKESLFTLKARHSLGALPEVSWKKVPAEHAHKVRETLNMLADDYRRAGPESVIDRAREAATAILGAYLQSVGEEKAKGKDLGQLRDLLTTKGGQHEQRIVNCAAEIAQRLHTRGKHAAKEQFDNLRPIREQDAELAVQCVGVMLCDLRWADWK
jgi:HEPN domain-containing protein